MYAQWERGVEQAVNQEINVSEVETHISTSPMHKVYISGCDDGTFWADNNMTRGKLVVAALYEKGSIKGNDSEKV